MHSCPFCSDCYLRFPEKGASIDTVKPDWMQPKTKVSIEGELQLSLYEKQIRISCRVKDMKEYVKENSQTN